MAGFRGLQEGVEVPVVGLGCAACWIHRLNVDVGVLLQKIDARARSLDLAAGRRGYGKPFAVDLAEVFDRVVDRAVGLDQVAHDVVDRHELIGVARRQPGVDRQNVVSRLCLRFRGSRQQQLVAVRRDVVDLDFDFFLFGPLLDEGFRGLVRVRNPVIPESDRELACGVGAADERSRHERGRQRSGTTDKTTTTDFTRAHAVSSSMPDTVRPARSLCPRCREAVVLKRNLAAMLCICCAPSNAFSNRTIEGRGFDTSLERRDAPAASPLWSGGQSCPESL